MTEELVEDKQSKGKPKAKAKKASQSKQKPAEHAKASAASDSSVQLVYNRNEFYKDSHQRLLMVLLVSVIVAVLSTVILLHIVLNPPEPKYFAVTADGRITPIVALNVPNLATSAVLSWASSAAVAAYSYNFVNYQKELQAASNFFTPTGWQSFIDALQISNNLSAIRSKKLIVSAVPRGAPIVLWQGQLPSNGRYGWRVQMPLLVTYQSPNQISQQQIVVNMLIVRVSTLYSVRGIGIDQFVAASE